MWSQDLSKQIHHFKKSFKSIIITVMVKVRVFSIDSCKLCSTKGDILHTGLTDIIGTLDGKWSIRKCPKCSLLWVDPMPVKEDISLAYLEYPTHEPETNKRISLKDRMKVGYLSWRYGFNRDNLGIVDKVLGSLFYLFPFKRVSTDFWFKYLKDYKSRGRLLDIGCGNGDLVRLMNQWGWQAEGIEPDHDAVLNARLKGMNVIHGDFLEYDFKEDSYDAIVSSHVFEHVFEPVDFLRKCYGILKPGGRLCIATPNAHSWQHQIFKASWMALDAPRHLYLFSPYSMDLCAKKADIKNYHIITTSRGSAFIASASMNIKRTGKYHWNDKIDFKSKFLANLFEIMEYVALYYDKTKGVELLLIAHK